MIKLDSSIHKTTKILYFILLGSTADAFLTYIGVSAGRIEEANPLMKNIVKNPHLLFGIKVLLPLAAVFIILKVLKKHSINLSTFTTLLINTAAFIYMAVLFLHIYCFFITL